MILFYAMIVVFVIGYGFIVFEHVNKIDKAASALVTGALLWTLLVIDGPAILQLGLNTNWLDYSAEFGKETAKTAMDFITHHAAIEHLGDVASIIFFLLGAMTIVEVIDRYQGFRIITDRIHTTNRIKLLWIISFITFFISAVLDNLTTTIVMITLLQKLLSKQDNRWLFSGMVVLAANAGGAWSPMGDVTTIMLWIGGQVTAAGIVKSLLLPSLVSMVVPLSIFSLVMKGATSRPLLEAEETAEFIPYKDRLKILIIGISALVAVPVFKGLTQLPPFLGMLLGLGALWIYTDRHLKRKHFLDKRKLSIVKILERVDVASILFFLGILLAVAALQTAGHLNLLAQWLDNNISNIFGINLIIGFLSSVVDNVPLVAASMGMYDISQVSDPGFMANFAINGHFWSFLAYCAGTGGSILIIGSAAGVAAMSLEGIPFFWYLRRISIPALIGYLAGAGTYILMFS
ncbi:sodium:proton antiporter NhaD [Thermophagus sp. OGC60D27]|uniref:sodium:proton antiporter NhaD n=1 Tax=Thermophagus sp. OGC60D27 TaxID=3458415 RepID=UPI0040377757